MSSRFLVLDRLAPDFADRLRAELDAAEKEEPARFLINGVEVTKDEFVRSVMDTTNCLAAAQKRAASIDGRFAATLGMSKAVKFNEVERVR